MEPRAASAHYDARTGMVVVTLRNGCTFSFPALLGQGLADASAFDLSQVRIEGDGYGLHWEMLDVDLAVPALLSGRFGSDKHMRRLAGVAPPRRAAGKISRTDKSQAA
jgi:hypothetical protein